jgi:hypothetical protein
MFKSKSIMVISAVLAVAVVAAPSSVQFNTVDKRGATFETFGDFTGSKSSYEDGTGTYVLSGDDHRYGPAGTGAHCWTDFFVVSNRVDALAWRRDKHSVDCATTSACIIEKVENTMNCTSMEIGVTLSFNIGKDIMSKVLGFEGGIEIEGSGGQEWCKTAEASASCEWDDKLCHQAWRSDMQRVDQGYIRRRCSRKGGDYTAWSKGMWRRITIATHTKFIPRLDDEKSRARDTHGLCCTLQLYVVSLRILYETY